MLVEVLTTAGRWNTEQPLLTYRVPTALEARLRRGQLIAVPYGDRLDEGIVWRVLADDEAAISLLEEGIELRDLSSILDETPALLPHQLELARWLSEYYATSLAHTVFNMLTPGLLQRSRFVLKLSQEALEDAMRSASSQDASLRLRALLGLLHTDGSLDVEQLKKMLGKTKAQQLLKEIKQSNLIVREPELVEGRAKIRLRRAVRLLVKGEELLIWREQLEERLRHAESEATAGSEVPHSVSASQATTKASANPWSLGTTASATLAPPVQSKAGLIIQRQLAALDLLQQSLNRGSPWTPAALCRATDLTERQLRQLEDERIISIERQELRRDPLQGRALPASQPLTLTQEQEQALRAVLDAVREGEQGTTPKPILLHGVTGSGKTEIYLQALAAIIAQGKRGVILVPEIALTTQAVQRVAGRFPDRVAIIHSELSVGERYDEWRRIRAGQVDVVIGSRSALFAPLPDLGLIIIDEEHEAAYKQSELKPTYHAREAALKLGEILRIPVVLGSATPAVESYHRAERGRYQLVELKGRIGTTLPPVEIVDLRVELRAGHTSIISRRLHEGLTNVLEQGQQAILFLNRRGAASCILCRDCGYTALCEHCDIPLTYHSTERVLMCHYCGAQSKPLRYCPACQSAEIRYFGLGTEKVQRTIQKMFPEARLLRWDRDTARNRHAHEALLDRFASRQADILIGTQMIAKGLDLPGVTLVGVVSADIALNLPDYSSPERAFTLLTQVAGRAGRGSEAGHVIIQTFNPEHFCIDTASRHNYDEFYRMEIETRERYGYPPFRQFVKFTYSHSNRHRCQLEAMRFSERLTHWINRLGLVNTDIVGPAPAMLERVRNKYRWQMIARGPDLHRLLRVVDAPDWEIDIDPISAL
ncbi:replication restart helicase PriA [Ktedonospora formicarum]|uniref:Replication restart protein PriA n=1 Tax=Ktedonospora formicarum TaxID=2778364 RepID=A0A8J3HZ21_9CHLR|nr:primosomal protein N' [Ktedonospora formicarum]GHO44611.1 primosomal protein N' [Ktedonospora formicarum]